MSARLTILNHSITMGGQAPDPRTGNAVLRRAAISNHFADLNLHVSIGALDSEPLRTRAAGPDREFVAAARPEVERLERRTAFEKSVDTELRRNKLARTDRALGAVLLAHARIDTQTVPRTCEAAP